MSEATGTESGTGLSCLKCGGKGVVHIEKLTYQRGQLTMAMEPSRDDRGNGLADVIDRILDKGLVINADIAVSVARSGIAGHQNQSRPGLL